MPFLCDRFASVPLVQGRGWPIGKREKGSRVVEGRDARDLFCLSLERENRNAPEKSDRCDLASVGIRGTESWHAIGEV